MAEEAEPNSARPNHPGRLKVICGCMFSGKTERLIARLLAARREGRLVVAFKHATDDRYSRRELVSHSRQHFVAEAVSSATEITARAGRAQVVAIDDGQFFDENLVAVCDRLRALGRRVIVAGLDRDCWSKPFHPIPEVAAIADEVVRTEAVCAGCGREATLTCRHTPIRAGHTMVGGPEAYEPRCAHCFRPPVVIEANESPMSS